MGRYLVVAQQLLFIHLRAVSTYVLCCRFMQRDSSSSQNMQQAASSMPVSEQSADFMHIIIFALIHKLTPYRNSLHRA